MQDTITVGKHACPACGGDLQWSAKEQALTCPYCGTIVPWAPSAEGAPGDIIEHDLEAALSDPAVDRGWGEQRREVSCQACHAISIFVGSKVASRCDFCGSPAIIATEARSEAITPQSVLPFKISDGQVRDLIRKWYGSRWFAPDRLRRAALTDTLHGVYIPYWTFDAHVDARWRAEAGYHYYVTETYTNAQGQRASRQVQRTRWEPASGKLAHFFDDELIAGSAGVHAGLMRQIEPFPTTTDLKTYSPEFVRGWTVERYQVDLRQASTRNMESMQSQVRSFCANAVPGDTQRNLQVEADYRGRSFKHVLVPIWLVSYTFGSRSFQIVANGFTGKLAGERPYSWIKIALAVVAAVMVAAIVVSVLQHAN